VLVEADMPGMDGHETSRLLQRVLPATVVVVLSVDGAPDLEALTPGVLRALWEDHGPD
jgi:DNA-binding NarL/FixJ family response regulator